MKFSLFVSILAMANAAESNSNLRRRTESAACSAGQLSEFACDYEGGSGAKVCRYGFSMCMDPADHESTDDCGPCEEAEEPRVDPPVEVEPEPVGENPLCSEADMDLYGCEITLGNGNVIQGALTCASSFTACVPLSSMGSDQQCGCCPGATIPEKCLELEELRFIDVVPAASASVACSAVEMQEFACEINNSTMGVHICRGGFSACMAPEMHKPSDTCGFCPLVDSPNGNGPPVEVPPEEHVIENPLCSTVDLADFACDMGSGVDGALICHMGFTACRPVNAVQDTNYCGCCPGDDSPRCLEGATPNSNPAVVLTKSGSP